MSVTSTEIKNQNVNFFVGMNLVLLFFFIVKISKMKIDDTIATTPPNFDGIERKMT